MAFNERIRQLREKNGLTQLQMAEILNIAKSTYVKYERGEREPRYGTLVAISQYFDVTTDYVLGMSDEENRYLEDLKKTFEFITSEEFAKDHGKNIKNVQKLIANYMRLPYLTIMPTLLDVFYPIVLMSELMIELEKEGHHIFGYKWMSIDDPDFVEAVDPPNNKDFIEFMSHLNELRSIVDNFITFISREEYYDQYYKNGRLFFEKEISEYANINKQDLILKFATDSRYKIEHGYPFD